MQQKLINKLAAYVKARGGDGLPFTSKEGLCAGLVAYWLYAQHAGEIGNFDFRVNYIRNWHRRRSNNHYQAEDPIIEQFLNTVVFLSYDVLLRHDLKQSNLDLSFKLLLGENQVSVAPAECSISFMFSKEMLTEALTKIVRPNKMVRFGSTLHTVGLYFTDYIYYFFDPNLAKVLPLKNIKQVVDAIFKGLSDKGMSGKYRFLNISVYDFDDVQPATYKISDLAFVEKYLSDKKFIQEITQSNIMFDLIISYASFDVFNMLISKTKFTDWVASNGTSAIGACILYDHPDTLYRLLINGSLTNREPTPGWTNANLAIAYKRTDALILLLACGLKLSDQELMFFKSMYKDAEITEILKYAIEINAKLLHVTIEDAARVHKPQQLFYTFNLVRSYPELSYEAEIAPLLALRLL